MTTTVIRVAELLHMVIYDLSQLEHRDLSFATKNLFQFSIGINHSPVLLILEIILLDILPYLLHNFGSW